MCDPWPVFVYWKFYIIKWKYSCREEGTGWFGECSWGEEAQAVQVMIEGIYSDILQAIETKVKNISSHNMIWRRGSPGIGKSALAVRILTQLLDQNRHVSKIIWDFPRLLKSIETSRIGEEEGMCTIHKFLPFIQQLWHSIAIHHNSCCIMKLFHTVIKNCIWEYIFARDHIEAKTMCIEGHWWM